MQMETVKKIYQDLKAYNNNFEYREMIIDKSIAVKIMLYPKYMIINKTGYDIFYHADKQVKSKTNDFVVGDQEVQKMKFRAKNYEDSQEIDLRNIGVA